MILRKIATLSIVVMLNASMIMGAESAALSFEQVKKAVAECCSIYQKNPRNISSHPHQKMQECSRTVLENLWYEKTEVTGEATALTIDVIHSFIQNIFKKDDCTARCSVVACREIGSLTCAMIKNKKVCSKETVKECVAIVKNALCAHIMSDVSNKEPALAALSAIIKYEQAGDLCPAMKEDAFSRQLLSIKREDFDNWQAAMRLLGEMCGIEVNDGLLNTLFDYLDGVKSEGLSTTVEKNTYLLRLCASLIAALQKSENRNPERIKKINDSLNLVANSSDTYGARKAQEFLKKLETVLGEGDDCPTAGAGAGAGADDCFSGLRFNCAKVTNPFADKLDKMVLDASTEAGSEVLDGAAAVQKFWEEAVILNNEVSDAAERRARAAEEAAVEKQKQLNEAEQELTLAMQQSSLLSDASAAEKLVQEAEWRQQAAEKAAAEARKKADDARNQAEEAQEEADAASKHLEAVARDWPE